MKKILLLSFVSVALYTNAQVTAKVERNGKSPIERTINFSDASLEDWDPTVLTIKEQPKPASDYGEKKELLKEIQKQKMTNPPASSRGSRGMNPPAPVMLNNFTANTAQGTPNDNHVAVSNDNKIISVVNTNIRVYDDSGTLLMNKVLSTFANALGVLSSVSDPRVIYDPAADRFIVMFFAGVTSSSSKIVVAFSQTNDPLGSWNFYKLNGNYLNDTTWSDYPIVSISGSDLFMTFNHLRDGQGWQTGFRYSAIWQIDKAKGYAGDSLEYNYWHGIELNGKPIWSVCAVQPDENYSTPETFFLSVRPGDLINDTVFLHRISDTYASGNAQFSSKVLKTDIAYGLPPNAPQVDGQYLATNDARVLTAIIHGNKIQYLQNCIDTNYYTAALYVGDIIDPNSASPTISGRIISFDSVDLGYPSIAYIGNNQFDHRTAITCSYSKRDTFPGTAAFYRDANGEISDILIVKQGENTLNVIADSVERWGDYSGIQKKYNEPNTAWLAGSYASGIRTNRTWIAKIVNTDSSMVSSVNYVKPVSQVAVYPNPATDRFSVELEIPANNSTRFLLYNQDGKLVRTLLEDSFKAGTAVFSFNTSYLPSGVYILNVYDRNALMESKKLVITR